MACQHSPDDQTLRLQAGAGEDDFIHLSTGPDRVACERQEEEEKSPKCLNLDSLLFFSKQPISSGLLLFVLTYKYITHIRTIFYNKIQRRVQTAFA